MNQPLFNVVFASDEHYLPYLDIALKSLLAHHHSLNIFIINTGNIPTAWVEYRRAFCRMRDCALYLVNIQDPAFNQLQGHGYITGATYLRYAIEELFPHSDSPNWLYLDCDLVVNGNLMEPFLLPEFANVPLAAVADPYVAMLQGKNFPPPKAQPYFNAGVLYINAKHWQNVKPLLIHATLKYQAYLQFGDQDILNLCFQSEYLPLPIKHNYQLGHIMLEDTTPTPNIIHYTGNNKPLSDPHTAFVPKLQPTVGLFYFYQNTTWQDIINIPLGMLRFDLYSQFTKTS